MFFVLAAPAVSLGPGVIAAPARPGQSASAVTARVQAVTPAAAAKQAPNPVTTQSGFGCAAALAYLAAHEAPGFRSVCPGDADGHEGMTCMNQAPICPGERLIVIADPCRNAYMNEASNSWVVLGLSDDAIDPYGSCWS